MLCCDHAFRTTPFLFNYPMFIPFKKNHNAYILGLLHFCVWYEYLSQFLCVQFIIFNLGLYFECRMIWKFLTGMFLGVCILKVVVAIACRIHSISHLKQIKLWRGLQVKRISFIRETAARWVHSIFYILFGLKSDKTSNNFLFIKKLCYSVLVPGCTINSSVSFMNA